MLVYTAPSFVPSLPGATFVVSVVMEPRTEIKAPCKSLEPAGDLGGKEPICAICSVEGTRFPKEELSVG